MRHRPRMRRSSAVHVELPRFMLSLYLPSKGRVTIASKCCFRPPTVVQFACSVARSELDQHRADPSAATSCVYPDRPRSRNTHFLRILSTTHDAPLGPYTRFRGLCKDPVSFRSKSASQIDSRSAFCGLTLLDNWNLTGGLG
jgi:hypothetical protein